jgi:hypothetical protein
MTDCSKDQDHVGTQVVSNDGRYRIQVAAFSPTPDCVQIEVAAPSGAFPSQRTTVPPVRFRLTADASLLYDSVKFDVRLQ